MLLTRVVSSLTPEASWGTGELVDCPPTSSLPLSIWQRRILKIAPWRFSYFVRGTWVLVFFICAFPSWIVKPFQICKSFPKRDHQLSTPISPTMHASTKPSTNPKTFLTDSCMFWEILLLLKSRSPILVTKLKCTFQTFKRKVCIMHNKVLARI